MLTYFVQPYSHKIHISTNIHSPSHLITDDGVLKRTILPLFSIPTYPNTVLLGGQSRHIGPHPPYYHNIGAQYVSLFPKERAFRYLNKNRLSVSPSIRLSTLKVRTTTDNRQQTTAYGLDHCRIPAQLFNDFVRVNYHQLGVIAPTRQRLSRISNQKITASPFIWRFSPGKRAPNQTLT